VLLISIQVVNGRFAGKLINCQSLQLRSYLRQISIFCCYVVLGKS